MSVASLLLRLLVALAAWPRPCRALAAATAGGSGTAAPRRLPALTRVTPEQRALAEQAMAYLDAAPDPFHAVQASVELLERAGFVPLTGPFRGRVRPGGRYYFTRNRSTLVAFAVGEQCPMMAAGAGDDDDDDDDTGEADGPAFKVIGAHTDSPNLRVKPRSKRGTGVSAGGASQIGVECYGGGLWHTWFDRDLGLSGRVLLRRKDDDGGGGGSGGKRIEQRLVAIRRPLLRIPNLAIHLQTAKEREAFAINKEDHLAPILALEAKRQLTDGDARDKEGDGASDSDNEKGGETKSAPDGWTEHQNPILLQVLAEELNVTAADIVDFELCLFDVQPAAVGGAASEFLHSARLDNLASCFMAVKALVDHAEAGRQAADRDVAMVVLYDHEEVGSASAVGAASPVVADAMRRILAALRQPSHDQATVGTDPDAYDACVRRSFVLSSDQAHAVHPNYAGKHEKAHQPRMNQGMVIKRNSNQRYATTTVTGVVVREIARQAGLPPVQEFVVRQDCGCGSTIGPVISAATGIRAIDMGCPQLSMHSIRETMGVCDLQNGLDLFKAFFEHYRDVDTSIEQ